MGILKLVTGFSKLRDDELDTMAQLIVSSMTDNANYPTPTPALADVSTAITAYTDALIQAKEGGRNKTIIKNERRKELENKLATLAAYVQLNCQNNLEILLSSGFKPRKTATRLGRLSRPENFKVEAGPKPGTMVVSVNKVVGAESYLFEFAPTPITPATQWVAKPATSRSSMIEGLVSGTQYAFQVAAVGADPTIVYSETITRYAQ